MKRLIALLMAAALLLCAPCVYAAEEAEYSFEGKDWDTVIGEFLDKYNIDPDTVAFGYYNTVTGEEHYHNADKYMIAASLYKLPLNMYFSELVYKGEIDWTTTYGGLSYEAIQRASIESSNNELSEMLQGYIGTYQQYRSAIAPYCGVSTDNMQEKFFHCNQFTPRQMIHALKLLYSQPERFPRVLDYMLAACPGNFFEYSEDRFEIAHKYGYVEYEEKYIYNDAAVVYTDDPILLVMFTNGCAGGVFTLARYCTLMCDYAQYTRELRLEEEERAEAEEQAENEMPPAIESPEPTPEPAPEPTPTPEPTPIPEPEPMETEEERQSGGFIGVFLLLAGLAGVYALVLGLKKKE